MPRPPDNSGKPRKPSTSQPRPPTPRKPPAHPREPAFARAVLEGIAEPMVVYGPDWTVRYENPAARAAFQAMGRSSLLRRNVWVEFPDLVGTTFEREMRRAMEERRPTSFTEERRATGHWTEVSCHPVPGGGVAAVWKDITQQKRAEQGMLYLTKASEVLAHSLDPDVTCDSLARLIVPELADWCSISLREGDAIRIAAVAHVDPEKVRLVREMFLKSPMSIDAETPTAHVIRSGEPDLIPIVTEEMIDRFIADPEHRALVKSVGFSSAIAVPLVVRDRVIGAMTLAATTPGSRRRFGTEDLRLAQQLAHRASIALDNAALYRQALEARGTAESANAAKSEFLARMSHELRTPLNAIGGYVDLIAMGLRGPLTAEQEEDLRRVKRSQRHLLALINDLLNFARLDAGKVQYDITDVPLADILENLEAIFAPQLQERRLSFSMEPITEPLVVHADAEKVHQIMLNLVSNALKFTPAGGSVRVCHRRRGELVELDVIDTGRGIPADKLETIFEPFVQIGRSMTSSGEGTGLGLAISRDLARAMGGDITASSALGEGATIRLTLPAARNG